MKSLQNLRNDIPASVVVFFVAVPLCLGIALASGAPAFSGLIAGIIGGIVVGAISGSPLGVSGPAAGLAVLVLNAIDRLGFETFLMALVIAGALQILMGKLRAGVLGYFFPSSVIRGMLAGIGVIIILKQIPHAFGYDGDPEGQLAFLQPDGENTFSELTHMLGSINGSATLIACVSLAILLLWDQVLSKRGKLFTFIQGPLVAATFGIVYQLVMSRVAPDYALSAEHLVSIPIPETLAGYTKLFTFPQWDQAFTPAVWFTAATIAIVASLETLLCVEAADKLDPQKRVTPTHRELYAQGVGNVFSGLIGGLPITQVIVRSSANVQSGAVSKMSAILHGVLLLLAVVLLPDVLNRLPLAVLAAILLMVGYKLASPKIFREMFSQGGAQFWPFVVTIVGIVLTDLLTGIGLGMAVAIVILLRRNYLNSHFLHMKSASVGDHSVVTLTLSEDVSFLNKGAILRELSSLPDGTEVTIDTSACFSIDHDVIEIIHDFMETATHRKITTTLIGELRAGPNISPIQPDTLSHA